MTYLQVTHNTGFGGYGWLVAIGVILAVIILGICLKAWPKLTVAAIILFAIMCRILDPQSFFLPKKTPEQCKADADRAVKEIHDFFKISPDETKEKHR